MNVCRNNFVIPAKAGIHLLPAQNCGCISWTPAFAGVTMSVGGQL